MFGEGGGACMYLNLCMSVRVYVCLFVGPLFERGSVTAANTSQVGVSSLPVTTRQVGRKLRRIL